MDTVYIETTIPSYLAQHPSAQEPRASHQKITHQWWNGERARFRLYTSLVVRNEAARGDSEAAELRANYLAAIPDLDVLDDTKRMAIEIARVLQLPKKAEADASHVAITITHRITYLLTWNCTHLANPILQKELIDYCSYHKLHIPVICTPEFLTNSTND